MVSQKLKTELECAAESLYTRYNLNDQLLTLSAAIPSVKNSKNFKDVNPSPRKREYYLRAHNQIKDLISSLESLES